MNGQCSRGERAQTSGLPILAQGLFARDLGHKNLTCFGLRAKPDLLLEVRSRWLLRMCLARKSYVLRPMSDWPGVGFLSTHLGLAGPWKDAPCWLGEKLAVMLTTANSSFPRGCFFFFFSRDSFLSLEVRLDFLICSSPQQLGLQVLLIQPLGWVCHYIGPVPHSSLGYCNFLWLVQQTSCPHSVQPEHSFSSTTPMTLFFPFQNHS